MFSLISSLRFIIAFISVHLRSSVVPLTCSSTSSPPHDTQPKITYHVKYQKDKMAEHIEDLQQRFAELNKRIQVVRSFL